MVSTSIEDFLMVYVYVVLYVLVLVLFVLFMLLFCVSVGYDMYEFVCVV